MSWADCCRRFSGRTIQFFSSASLLTESSVLLLSIRIIRAMLHWYGPRIHTELNSRLVYVRRKVRMTSSVGRALARWHFYCDIEREARASWADSDSAPHCVALMQSALLATSSPVKQPTRRRRRKQQQQPASGSHFGIFTATAPSRQPSTRKRAQHARSDLSASSLANVHARQSTTTTSLSLSLSLSVY